MKVVSFSQTYLNSFQAVKDRASKFVIDRDWTQFHKPMNIALALSGECGELCEIFQWKGQIESNQASFTDKELIHIGEEISDVFIYSTRLCTICNINLPYLVSEYIQHGDNLFDTNINNYMNDNWIDISFDDLPSQFNSVDVNESREIRGIVCSIFAKAGLVCELFSLKSECLSTPDLSAWPEKDKLKLSIAIAAICSHLLYLSSRLNLNLGRCITDKYTKNDAKYPVNLVKGSSAKYTAYVNIINKNNVNARLAATIGGSLVLTAIILGLVFVRGSLYLAK